MALDAGRAKDRDLDTLAGLLLEKMKSKVSGFDFKQDQSGLDATAEAIVEHLDAFLDSVPHDISSHTDTTATGVELDELTGGGTTVLHGHAASVFGSELNIVSDPSVTTTTETDFQLKVRLPVAGDLTLPAGTYLLAVSYGWNRDSTSTDFEAEVREDDVRIGEHHKEVSFNNDGTFESTGTDQRFYTTREFHRVLTAGDYHWDFRYRSAAGAATEASTWDTYMRIWRIL